MRVLLILFVLLAGCSRDGRAAYVGTWEQADREMPTRYTFFADGRARIVERVDGEPRAYEAEFLLDGDSVLVLADDQSTERFQVLLEGDTLRIRSPETRRVTALVRVRPG